jgi:hypothetical protein
VARSALAPVDQSQPVQRLFAFPLAVQLQHPLHPRIGVRVHLHRHGGAVAHPDAACRLPVGPGQVQRLRVGRPQRSGHVLHGGGGRLVATEDQAGGAVLVVVPAAQGAEVCGRHRVVQVGAERRLDGHVRGEHQPVLSAFAPNLTA